MSYESDVAAAKEALAKAEADLATAQSTAQSATASVTAAEAAVARAQAALDVAVRNAQTANSAVTSAQNMVTQAQSHLDYLLANPPVVTPPTPVGKILIGATVGNNDGGLNLQADLRRGYDLAGSGAQKAIARTMVGGMVWVSYKGSISDASLRSNLATLSNQLKPKNLTGLVTYEHEPSIKDIIDPVVYHKGYDQLERIIAEFPSLSAIVCLVGFQGDKGDTSLWERYYRPNHPIIGFDHYNKGHQQNGEPLSTPAENYGKMVAWTKSKGKKMMIGETGVGDDAVPGPTIKTNSQWYAAHRAYVLDPANGILGACAYDSGTAVLNQAEAKAWFGV